MIVIGVDPGLRVTGYGAIALDAAGAHLIEAGTIAPPTTAPFEARLAALHRELGKILASVRPDVLVIEELWSGYKNPTTAVLMGHARGVLCLAAHDHGVPVRHLVHSMVKRALAGSGAARKEQVKRMVMEQLHLRVRPDPDDVSDALALALAFANIDAGDRRLARASAI
ncbi:MAG: crossover junction endodeoxyribonuclease RuvC [Vulcanimicrobiaceae bacterium]